MHTRRLSCGSSCTGRMRVSPTKARIFVVIQRPRLWCVIGRIAAGTQETGGSLEKRTPPTAHPSWSPGESQLPRALVRRHSRRSHERPADQANQQPARPPRAPVPPFASYGTSTRCFTILLK